MKTTKKDNSTLTKKISLRKKLLKELDAPVIMETHGGKGDVWQRCYQDIPFGVVFEKDDKKISILAEQRPDWAVYQCDCIAGLQAKIQSIFRINFVDIDPYGDPWPVIDYFFKGMSQKVEALGIVVNDGLRLGLNMNIGWNFSSLKKAVNKYGNQSIYANYLDVCQETLTEKAEEHGYSLGLWGGYYCGKNKQMTHYAAILTS